MSIDADLFFSYSIQNVKEQQVPVLKAYKYRIYPTQEQEELITKHFGCARHVYNWALHLKQTHYHETGKSLSKRALQDLLVASKKADKPWLNEVNSQSLLASLLHLDSAFGNFFKKIAKFPRYKKKYASWQSFQCPQHAAVNFEEGALHLPKMKNIPIKFHREFSGKIKTVTVKKAPSGKYFVSILVEEPHSLPITTVIEPDKTLGLDMGIQHFLIDSEGHKIDNPKYLYHGLKKLRAQQRKLSRMSKNSHNRAKQKSKVAILHEKVANKRYDFAHQISAIFANKNHVTSFAIEDLHIKGMIQNRKLARAIADCGWGMFLNTLSYKCEWQGKNLIKIDRFAASSKTCSKCGVKQAKLPLFIRNWTCVCGAQHDRDINAAIMIKQFSLAQPPGQCVAA